MIKNYNKKLSKNLIQKTVDGDNVKLSVRTRDEDDEIVWRDAGVFNVQLLDSLIANITANIETLRDEKKNLEAMKSDLFPQLKK